MVEKVREGVIISDPFLKLSALVPLIGSLFLFMSKIKIFEKFNIKINLGDLDIYFVKKIK